MAPGVRLLLYNSIYSIKRCELQGIIKINYCREMTQKDITEKHYPS
jgi:hypothetical protein